jgi:hypothetical protein
MAEVSLLEQLAADLLEALAIQMMDGCSTCGRTLNQRMPINEHCCGCSHAREAVRRAKQFSSSAVAEARQRCKKAGIPL